MAAEDMVVEVVARIELQHLPDLLLDRHAVEEVGDAGGDRQFGVEIGQGFGQCLRGHHF